MRKPYSLEVRREVESLKRDGLTYAKISHQTGVSARTVVRWCSESGLVSEQVQMYGADCKVEGCSRRARSKFLCLQHYIASWNEGPYDVEYQRNAINRFMSKVSFDDPYHWLWVGGVQTTSPYGLQYGGFFAMGESAAHRAAYRLFVRDIPDGYQIDHACSTTLCVYPLHLEAVPQQENIRRTWERGRGRGRRMTSLEFGEWMTAA